VRFPVTRDDPRPYAPLVEKWDGSPPPAWDDHRLRIVRPVASSLRAYQGVVYLHGPLLALMLVLVGIGVLRARGREDRVWLLAPALAGIGLIVLPVMTVTFDYRFLLPAIPLLSIGAGAALGRWWAPAATNDAPDRPDREAG
jgi:hypothetical protein